MADSQNAVWLPVLLPCAGPLTVWAKAFGCPSARALWCHQSSCQSTLSPAARPTYSSPKTPGTSGKCVCVYYMCIQADWVSQTPKPRRLILNVLFGSKQSVFQFDLKWNTTPGSYCDGKLHSGTDFPSVIHSPLSQDMWSSPIKAKSRQDKGGVIFKEVRFIATICLMFSQ